MSSSPTQLAFTPTSVLRKMTGENKPSDISGSETNKNSGAVASNSVTSSQSLAQISSNYIVILLKIY